MKESQPFRERISHQKNPPQTGIKKSPFTLKMSTKNPRFFRGFVHVWVMRIHQTVEKVSVGLRYLVRKMNQSISPTPVYNDEGRIRSFGTYSNKIEYKKTQQTTLYRCNTRNVGKRMNLFTLEGLVYACRVC